MWNRAYISYLVWAYDLHFSSCFRRWRLRGGQFCPYLFLYALTVGQANTRPTAPSRMAAMKYMICCFRRLVLSFIRMEWQLDSKLLTFWIMVKRQAWSSKASIVHRWVSFLASLYNASLRQPCCSGYMTACHIVFCRQWSSILERYPVQRCWVFVSGINAWDLSFLRSSKLWGNRTIGSLGWIASSFLIILVAIYNPAGIAAQKGCHHNSSALSLLCVQTLLCSLPVMLLICCQFPCLFLQTITSSLFISI